MGCNGVIPLVVAEAEDEICFDGVEALVLERIGLNLINKADPPAFLSQIENEPPLERPDGLELYFGNRKLNCMRHSRFELGAVSGRTTL